MTLTVSASADWAPMPRVLVDVSSSPSTLDELAVWRVHEDGRRYRVLTQGRAVMSGSWAGYDYHVPFNQSFSYTVETPSQTGSSAQLIVPSDRVWLVHPSNPVLSLSPAKLALDPFQQDYDSNAEAFWVLGRSEPVMRSHGRRKAASGNASIKLTTPEDRKTALKLFESDSPILMNSPFEEALGWMWVQPGKVTMRNPSSYVGHPDRWVDFSWQQCAQPANSTFATWDIASAAAAFPDIASMAAAYTDIKSLALDQRL